MIEMKYKHIRSAYHFIPIFLAAVGAMPWDLVISEQAAEKQRLRDVAQEEVASDSESCADSAESES